jgi:hypothetical protein
MAIDWDRKVVGPCVSVFGRGDRGNPTPIPYVSTVDGSEFFINGVFDEAYTEVSLMGVDPVATVMPVLGVQLSSFPRGIQPQQDDMLIIGRNRFTVGNIEPDSHGWALLKLNLVAHLDDEC